MTTELELREATRRRLQAAAFAALAAYAAILLSIGAGSPAGINGSTAGEPPNSTSDTLATAPIEQDLTEPSVAVARPTSLRVPAIGVDTSLIGLGLAGDGTMEVPEGENYDRAGWYELGAAPGDVGPAVIAGHVDSKRTPSVFFQLGEIEPGTEIFVTDAAGIEHRFVTEAVEQHGKETFPSQQVYGPTTGAELRLITCGGVFDRTASEYEDNVIVFARLA